MRNNNEFTQKLIWLNDVETHERWVCPLYAIHNNGYHLYMSSNATQNFFVDVRRITDWKRVVYSKFKYNHGKCATIQYYPFIHHGHVGEVRRRFKRPANFSIGIVRWQTSRVGVHETLYFFELERKAVAFSIIEPLEWGSLEGSRQIMF